MGLVVVLVAGVVTFLLVGDDDSGAPTERGPGGRGAGERCSGDYCVGDYPYVNACGVLDPSSMPTRIGPVGDEGVRVTEIHTDPLPRVDPSSRPSWTYGTHSTCTIAADDYEGTAAFRDVTLEMRQYGAEPPADKLPTDGVRPLEGAEGAVVEDQDGAAAVHWQSRNISFRLALSWGRKKADIPHAAMAKIVNSVTAGLADAPGEPAGLGDLSQGGDRVVTDACTVFTGPDFQDAVGYVVNPARVTRKYTLPARSSVTSSCARTTATKNQGFPAPDGVTYLDGAMSPKVTVTAHPDPAAARSALAKDRGDIDGAADIPGIGEKAVFGVGNPSYFSLLFTVGPHLVRVDCGLTNGTSDWTPKDMRDRLEPLAKAIAARFG
ncbi:hypothetical protein ACTG9Q_14335 [Actinokineospora sp. 24-640]